jgi:serpin B
LFVLVDAAVFRAQWKAPLNAVKQGLNFQLPDGTWSKRDSVRGEMEIRVYKAPDGVVAGSIPFASEDYEMVIVLPPVKTVDLRPARQAVATPAQLKQLLTDLDLCKPRSRDLELPALNLSQKLDLRRVGAGLGIKELFTPNKTTFTGLFAKEEPEAIQFAAVQAVTFQLDQNGVTATALNTSGITTIGEDDTPSFHVNRPFLFLLRDRALGCALFVGQVVDPR